MRIHVGPPPSHPQFEPQQGGWRPLKEPTPFVLQVIAAPVAVGLAALLYLGWTILTPVESSSFNITIESSRPGMPTASSPLMTLASLFVGFFLLILAHELVHAFAMPDGGISQQTLIGVWPSRMLFYAAHLGPMSRDRFLFVFVAPLLAITVIPLMTCALLQISRPLIAIVSIVNGACACGDLVGAAMIAWQVPREALVQNQGWRTWWKPV